MNYPAHANIFRGAVAALPIAIQDRLKPHEDLFDDAGNYPDIFDNGTLPERDKDLLDPDWRRFCLFPASLSGRTMHSWPFPKEQQKDHLPLLSWLLTNAVESWKVGDIRSAIKFVGCMSHYLGDICQPAHLMDQHLMSEILPAPAAKADFHYHWTIEAVVGACASLDGPQLLGASIDEAVWRQSEFNRRAMATCRGYIVPTVQALFRDEMDEAIRLAGVPVTIAAEGTRDIFYTVVCLAEGSDLVTPSRIDLRTWTPDISRHPVAYGQAFVDMSMDSHPQNLGNILVPTMLRVDADTITQVHGIGVISRSSLTYTIPTGLFDRFTATIGLHPEIAKEGNADFVVRLDRIEAYRSGPRRASDVAETISVPLGESSEITLDIEDPSGGLTFYHNHAIWADPALVRD